MVGNKLWWRAAWREGRSLRLRPTVLWPPHRWVTIRGRCFKLIGPLRRQHLESVRVRHLSDLISGSTPWMGECLRRHHWHVIEWSTVRPMSDRRHQSGRPNSRRLCRF